MFTSQPGWVGHLSCGIISEVRLNYHFEFLVPAVCTVIIKVTVTKKGFCIP